MLDIMVINNYIKCHDLTVMTTLYSVQLNIIFTVHIENTIYYSNIDQIHIYREFFTN